MDSIIREDRPAWYELSFDSVAQGINLRIHERFLEAHPLSQLEKAPIVEDFCKSFGFPGFSVAGDSISFNDSFRDHGAEGDFRRFFLSIPRIRVAVDEPCDLCGGSGEDQFSDRKCLGCEEGRKTILEWDKAYAISATLTVLLTWLSLWEGNTGAALPQMLTVRTSTLKGMEGGSLSGEYSRPLVAWLGGMPLYTPIIEMQYAMRETHRGMMGEQRFSLRFDARVDHKGGGLNVTCPGNACGLNPSHNGLREGRGYKFECHNVDSPMQQLALLAGLAALCDRARSEMR